MLPISKDEELKFPDNFSFIIKDSSKGVIRQYDKRNIFKNIISKPMIANNEEKYKAEEWILK